MVLPYKIKKIKNDLDDSCTINIKFNNTKLPFSQIQVKKEKALKLKYYSNNTYFQRPERNCFLNTTLFQHFLSTKFTIIIKVVRIWYDIRNIFLKKSVGTLFQICLKNILPKIECV